MRLERGLVVFLALLAFACAPRTAAARAGQAGGEVEMLQPSDLFPHFPELRWKMSLQAAKDAVEKTGAHPFASGGAEHRLTWDGKFGEMDGRATILFKEGSGLYEIAVIVYALDKRQEVFEQMSRRISDRHGEAKEVSDTSVDTSKLWRLKDGTAIELRLIKDEDSPVIDVHWVRG